MRQEKSLNNENSKFKNPDWSKVKYRNMYKVLKLKAEQNPVVKKKY